MESDEKRTNTLTNFYRISVVGSMHANNRTYFENMNIETILNESGKELTVLQGMVKDQSELIGILNMLFDLNYSIHSVEAGLNEQRSQDSHNHDSDRKAS